LHQNYPNPFNPTTNIKFDIIRNEAVKLEVYDITGRVINTLVNGKLEAGKYSYTLDASSLPSGVYFYKLATDNYTMTRRMILLK
jgi:flagellar hook assembly protein FlgD